MSGNADGSNTNEDEGEWRIIVEKKRSLWQRLSGKGRIAENDEMTVLVEQILSGDPILRDVHREEQDKTQQPQSARKHIIQPLGYPLSRLLQSDLPRVLRRRWLKS